MATTPLRLDWSRTGLNPVQLPPKDDKKLNSGRRHSVNGSLPSGAEKVNVAANRIPKINPSGKLKKAVKKLSNSLIATRSKSRNGKEPKYGEPVPVYIQGGTRRGSKAETQPPLPVHSEPPMSSREGRVVPPSKVPNPKSATLPIPVAKQEEKSRDDRIRNISHEALHEPEPRNRNQEGLFSKEELLEASLLKLPSHIREAVRTALIEGSAKEPPVRRNDPPVELEFPKNSVPPTQQSRLLSVGVLNGVISRNSDEAVETLELGEHPFDLPLQKIIPSSEEISMLSLPEVEILDLANSNISDEQLLALITRFPNVKKVILQNCPRLTSKIMTPLASLKKLEYLSLNSCNRFTSDEIFEMLNEASWPYISELDFGSTSFSDECLALVENRFPKLTITLTFCSKVSNTMMDDVKKKSRLTIVMAVGHFLETQRGFASLQDEESIEPLGTEQADREQTRPLPRDESPPLQGEVLQSDVFSDEAVPLYGGYAEVPTGAYAGSFDVAFTSEMNVEFVEPIAVTNGELSTNKHRSKVEKRALFLEDFLAGKGVYENYAEALSRYEAEITRFYRDRLTHYKDHTFQELSKEMWLDLDLFLQKQQAKENMEKILAVHWDEDERGINWESLGVRPPADIRSFMDLLEKQPDVFRKLTKLNLSNMGLTFFPQVFAQANFHHLESLDLSGNQIRVFPPNFFCFAPRLKTVHLQDNGIRALPAEFLQFWHHLNWLDLSENHLGYFATNFFFSSAELVCIILSNNKLSRDSFSNKDWEYLNNPCRSVDCTENVDLEKKSENARMLVGKKSHSKSKLF